MFSCSTGRQAKMGSKDAPMAFYPSDGRHIDVASFRRWSTFLAPERCHKVTAAGGTRRLQSNYLLSCQSTSELPYQAALERLPATHRFF